MPALRFLNEALIERIRERFGTPVYVYDQATLEQAAREVAAFPAPCSLVGRYAMKALPNRSVLKIFDAAGLHVDASSGFEAEEITDIEAFCSYAITTFLHTMYVHMHLIYHKNKLIAFCTNKTIRHAFEF